MPPPQLIERVSSGSISADASLLSPARSTTISTPCKISGSKSRMSSAMIAAFSLSAILSTRSLPKKNRSRAIREWPRSSSFLHSGTPMYPPAPATNTFAIDYGPLSARRCRRRGDLPECTLYSWCSVVHLEEGLHDPVALVLGHIIVDRQGEHTVGTRLASRQRHIMARGVGAHMVTWRAIILPDVQVFFGERCRHVVSVEPELAFVDEYREVEPDRVLVVWSRCNRQTRQFG